MLAALLVGCAVAGASTFPSADATAQEPLLAAITSDDAAAVRELATAGADLSAPLARAGSALHLAAACGSATVVPVLLEAGADPAAGGAAGCDATPVHVAAARVGDGVLAAFVAAGVDVDAPDAYGVTPLGWAVCAGADASRVTALLNAGADASTSMLSGHNALDLAAACGRDDLVELLSARGFEASGTEAAVVPPLGVLSVVYRAPVRLG